MNRLRLVLLVSSGLGASALGEPAGATNDGPKLELEASAGAMSRDSVAPTVAARLGVDVWNWFTPSVRVLSVAPWSGRASGWALQGELRAHTRGSLVQLTFGAGIGLATANVLRGEARLEATVERPARPWLTGDLGVRVLLGPCFVGASVAYAPLQQQWLGALSLGLIAFGG